MKSNLFKQNAVSFVVGLVFAIGLAVSGMTQPQKIISFLNPSNWDASLLFVMLGALGVHLISYPLIRKRKSPLLETKWHIPTRQDVTARLVLGSALFGIGWGLAGFCPGPALTSLASGDVKSLLFVATMIFGMLLFKKTEAHLKLKE
ncbi:YeeE/YedE family protein [bacterium]|nr:YeeE/YedE family protein [bacterium]